MDNENPELPMLSRRLRQQLALRVSALAEREDCASDVPPEAQGKTIADILLEPDASLDSLKFVKHILHHYSTTANPVDQLVAGLLYYVAVAVGLVRYDQRLSPRDDVSLRAYLIEIAELPWVSPDLSALLDDAAAKLSHSTLESSNVVTSAGDDHPANSRRRSPLRAVVMAAVLFGLVALAFVMFKNDWSGGNASASSAGPDEPVSTQEILQTDFEGVHDYVDGKVILGWAWDKTRPNTPISVTIDDGVNPTITILADHFVQGLVDAKKGDGRHYFIYNTPPNLLDGKPHVIRVRIAGTKYLLIGTGKTLIASRDGNTAPELLTPTLPRASGAPALDAAGCRQIIWQIFGDIQSKGLVMLRGSDGWYFHSSELVAFGGEPDPQNQAASFPRVPPERDPLPAIVAFKNELAERGIELLVIPLPPKIMLYRDKLDARLAYTGRFDDDYQHFNAALEKSGVTLIDVYDDWVAMRKRGIDPFLQQDSHPTPEGMRLVAQRAAEMIRKQAWYASAPKLNDVKVVDTGSEWKGDMPQLLSSSERPPPQHLEHKSVFVDGKPVMGDRSGPIVIIGDSTGSVFVANADGVGPTLTSELNVGVDICSVSGLPANASRLLLKRREDNLAGKKCIVWVFDEMFLMLSDRPWQVFRVTDPVSTTNPARAIAEDNDTRFFVPKETAGLVVTGIVKELSAVGEPGKSTYRDHVMTIYLSDLHTDAGDAISPSQSLVCAYSMLDNRLQPAGKYQPGDRVRMRLLPWQTVSTGTERIRRSELAEDDLLLEEHVWGDPAPR